MPLLRAQPPLGRPLDEELGEHRDDEGERVGDQRGGLPAPLRLVLGEVPEQRVVPDVEHQRVAAGDHQGTPAERPGQQVRRRGGHGRGQHEHEHVDVQQPAAEAEVPRLVHDRAHQRDEHQRGDDQRRPGVGPQLLGVREHRRGQGAPQQAVGTGLHADQRREHALGLVDVLAVEHHDQEGGGEGGDQDEPPPADQEHDEQDQADHPEVRADVPEVAEVGAGLEGVLADVAVPGVRHDPPGRLAGVGALVGDHQVPVEGRHGQHQDHQRVDVGRDPDPAAQPDHARADPAGRVDLAQHGAGGQEAAHDEEDGDRVVAAGEQPADGRPLVGGRHDPGVRQQDQDDRPATDAVEQAVAARRHLLGHGRTVVPGPGP